MAKFKITGLPKAQGGLIVNDPLDPRLKAYNDSLSLYNRFPMPRDRSHFWPIRTKEEAKRLAKDFGTGTRILPVGIDSYDAVLRNGLYYHKPIFKKPKLKVTLEEKEIEDLRLPINPINTADIEAMMSPMPRDIVQVPVRRVPNDSIVPPASKEVWLTTPDGQPYRVERPVDPRLTKPVKIGFYQKGGTKGSSLYIADPKEYAFRKAAYDDSLTLYKNNKEFIEAKEALVKADAKLKSSRNRTKNIKAFNKAMKLEEAVHMKEYMYHLERADNPLLKGLVNVPDRPVNTHYAFKNSTGFDRPVQHIYKKKKKTVGPKFERTMVDEVPEPPVNDFTDIRLPILPLKTIERQYPDEIIQRPNYTAYPRETGDIIPPQSKEIWLTTPDGTHYRVERPVDPRLTKKVKIGFYQGGGQLQPGYYKYKHKPEASYKYDGNQWYISNEGTKGNYQPIEDPNGTRSKTLAKGLEYGTTEFYAPLAENVQNQTTFPQVSQKSIQTSQQNLNADLANQKQAVDNLTEYQNRKRNQTDYNVRDLPEEKGWYYNQGETLKGVADESVGDVDSKTAAITALSGDAEEAVQYIMSDPNYNLPANNQGLMQAREMVKYWTPQQVEQFVVPRREAYLESEREGIYNQPKSKISFDAPENPTFEDYAGRAWDIAMNPIDAFNWSTATGDVSNMPWNMRQYENAKAATGSTDITDDNLVGNALDFLSYFTPAGLVGQGIKMIPQTNESVNRLMDDPTWSNAGTAAMDVASNAMMLSPLGRFTGRGFNPRNFRTNINNTKFQVPSRTDMVDAALNIDPRAQQSDIATAFNTVTMANDLRSGKKTIDNKPSTSNEAPSNITWPWSGWFTNSQSGHYNDPNRQRALADLQNRNQSTTNNLGNEAAKAEFEKLHQERLALADTPEGRRRIQKHIDDNEIGYKFFDEGNKSQLKASIEDRLANHIANGNYEKEDYKILEGIKKWGATQGSASAPADSWFVDTDWGSKPWDEITMDDLKVLHPDDMEFFSDLAATAHPDYTGSKKDKKISVDSYIDSMKEMEYSSGYNKSKMIKDIHENEMKPAVYSLTAEEDVLKNMINNPNYYTTQDIQNQDDLLTLIREDIKKVYAKIADLNNLYPDDNAYYVDRYFTDPNPNIWIGRDYRASKDLGYTLDHEYAHATDLIRRDSFNYGKGNNRETSKMSRDLIDELELEDVMPKHLEQRIKPEDIENEVGYNTTNIGLKKALNPPTYFSSAKTYFLEGRGLKKGDSNEPVAFLAEVRKALLNDGMIKSIHDPVTPEIIEKAYKKYTTDPLYTNDLRLFDIIKGKSKNFKTLSKHMNNLQVLAPYLVGAGAIGTMLSGAGEEEPEMKMGGIVIDLDKSSIDDYVNQGYIVVEE